MSEAKRLRREAQMQVQRCGEFRFSFFLSPCDAAGLGQRPGFAAKRWWRCRKTALYCELCRFPAERGASMRARQGQTQQRKRETPPLLRCESEGLSAPAALK